MSAARPFEIRDEHRRAGAAFAELVALQDRLRSEGGCPWDAQQTHRSLGKHLLDESYEVLDVLDELPDEAPSGAVDAALYAHLGEELGDLVMQVVFHARLAEEAGAFDAAEVVSGIVDKLVARHPHVFADVVADTPDAVVETWEAVKRTEKDRDSALEGIPGALPALSRAAKVVSRTRSAGAQWGDPDRVVRRCVDAVSKYAQTRSEADLGNALFGLAAAGKLSGTDPEGALRQTVKRWESAYRAGEIETDVLANDDPSAMVDVWDLGQGQPS